MSNLIQRRMRLDRLYMVFTLMPLFRQYYTRTVAMDSHSIISRVPSRV